MPPSKPPKLIEVETLRLNHDLSGVGTFEGKTTFVEGAWEGERVIAEVIQSKANLIRARAREILRPSPLRISPRCPFTLPLAGLSVCGGCALLHVPPEIQRQAKANVVSELLRRVLSRCPEAVEAESLSLHDYHYRRRARLSVHYSQKEDRVHLGFRERFSHRVTRMDHCAVLDEMFTDLEPLRLMIESLSVKRAVPQVELTLGQKEDGSADGAACLRILEPPSGADMQRLTEYFADRKMRAFLDLDGKGPSPIGEGHETALFFRDLPDGLALEFGPQDFIQVHSGLNRLMLEQAMAWLAPQAHEKAVDAFCGLGNFTLPLGLRCERVFGVEWSAVMVEKLKRNARREGLEARISAEAANLEDPETILALTQAWHAQGVELLVLDPPRSGAKTLIEALCAGAWRPKRILYLSCNPITLARDLELLTDAGIYRLLRYGPVDFFTHTPHTEVMTLLSL